jgi:hypothetical protein
MRYLTLEGDGDFVDLIAAYVKVGWMVPIYNTMLRVCSDL